MEDFVALLVICTSFISPSFSATISTVGVSRSVTSAPPTTDGGGLEGGDIAAIILGCLLICIVILTVVLCVLYQKGYLGNREDQVLPLFPDIYTTPESLRQFSTEAIERSSKKRKYGYKEKEPIIYMHDDIYYPPKSRPLPADGRSTGQYPELVLPVKVPRRHRTRRMPSRRRRQSLWSRHECSQMTSPKSLYMASYPDDAVFIPEKGGMKFTMFYETRSPYANRDFFSKTF